MCENLFHLPDLPAPEAPHKEPDPVTVSLHDSQGERQGEMFEEWQKIGLPGLFETEQDKEQKP